MIHSKNLQQQTNLAFYFVLTTSSGVFPKTEQAPANPPKSFANIVKSSKSLKL